MGLYERLVADAVEMNGRLRVECCNLISPEVFIDALNSNEIAKKGYKLNKRRYKGYAHGLSYRNYNFITVTECKISEL